MAQKRVLLLFDLASSPPEDQNYRSFVKDSSWDHEISVKRALQRKGYEVILQGVFDDLPRMIAEIKKTQPNVIFNMVESFNNQRENEAQVAGVLELLGIPFTGTKSIGLSICQNKALAKKILQHHRIRVANWVISKNLRPLKKIKGLAYPLFIKPALSEGSEGIAVDSLVENEKDAIDRIYFLHEKFNSDVVVEEYIDGRELYVSVLCKKLPKVLPIRELSFKRMPDDGPRFATYKTKWDEKYRKRWGIRNEFAKDLTDTQEKQVGKMVKRAFEALRLNTYARFDFRLRDSGELVMLEANPNPSIADFDDFALSAKKAGIEYDDLIQLLVKQAQKPSI